MQWQKVNLSLVVENLDFKRKPLNDVEREKISKLGLYPYIGANNIMGYVDEFIFDGQILCLAEDGGNWGEGQRCAVIYEGKTWVNNHAHVLKAKKGLNLRYLMYFLNQADLNRYISGSTRGKLTKRALDTIEIPLPPLYVQQKITEILDRVDMLRQKDRKLLQKYDDLAQSIFYDMFGDPVKNEKGWDTKELGSFTDIGSGSTPSREKNEYFNGTIPWVKTTEVNGTLILDTEEKITNLGLSQSSCRLFQKNSIIIAMYGQGKTRGSVGLLGCEAATNQACAVIKQSPEIVTQFLFNQLKLCYNDLRALGRGGNQANLNLGMIKNYQIIAPPIHLQELFSKRIKLIYKLKKLSILNSDNSKALFDSLIQYHFN